MLSFKDYLSSMLAEAFAFVDPALEAQPVANIPQDEEGKTFFTDAGFVKMYNNGTMQFSNAGVVNQFTTDEITQILSGQKVKGFVLDVQNPANEFNENNQSGTAVIRSGKLEYHVPEEITRGIIADLQNPNKTQQVQDTTQVPQY